MCMVPIWVSYKNSRKMFKTYAMLDKCRLVGSFFRNELIENLEILEGNCSLV